MPTEYPLRTDSDIKNHLREICECGHADLYHDGGGKEKCSVCFCPQYKYEQTLTVQESLDLRLHLMSIASRKGNQQ